MMANLYREMGAAKMPRALGGQAFLVTRGLCDIGGGLPCKNRVGRRGQAGYSFAGIGPENCDDSLYRGWLFG